MTTRARPLDAQELGQLEQLLARALPPHHALYRTARAWYVYRWEGVRYVPLLDAPALGALLAKLQDKYCSQ